MTNAPMTGENLDTYTQIEREPCEGTGRFQGDAAKSKECRRLPETTGSLERSTQHISLSQPSGEEPC